MKRAIRIAALLFAASALATPAVAGKTDDTLRFAHQQVLAGLDPYYSVPFFSMVIADHIWDTLIYRDPETGAYKGNLATGWRRIDDRTLEFDLRQGVRFHDGAVFDADDVVYTFNFVANPENKALNARFVGWIDHAERIGKYKVRVVSKQPFPAAVAYLASPRLAVFPHAYYERVGPNGMSEQPIGTGPYRVVEHSAGKRVRLTRNRDYFKDSPKPQPKIANVDIRFIPDRQTQVAEAAAGGLDLIMDVVRDQAEQLQGIEGLAVVGSDTTGYSMLQFNVLRNTPAPQLRDVRVRQAIFYAIDREAIVRYIIGNRARVLHTECYPGQIGCTDKDVMRYPYDPGRARQLLAEAGFASGFTLDFYAANSASGNRNEVEAIIGYLRAVGINARMRVLQMDALISASRAGKVPLRIIGTTNNIDDVSAFFSAGHNFSPEDMSRDPEIRDLVNRGDTTIDPVARNDAYANAFRLVAERAYLLPLHSMPNFYVAAKDLVFEPHTDTIPRFYEMSWK